MSKLIPLYQTDESIIEGIRNYDEVAGTIAYNKHKDYCLRFMYRMYKDEEAIKDIYQDAVIVLIENIRHKNLVLDKTSIQTYLNSICRNQVLVRFKQNSKRAPVADGLDNEFSDKYNDWFDDETDSKNDRIRVIMEELEVMKEKGQICYELLRKVFLMTTPALPPAFKIFMKCCRNKLAVSPVLIGKFC